MSIPSEGPYRNEIILKKIAKEENCIKYKSLFNRAVIRGANATSEWLIERTFNKKGNAKPEDGPTTHESNPHSKD